MSMDRFRSVDIRIDKADHYFMSSQFAKGGATVQNWRAIVQASQIVSNNLLA